MNELTYDQRTSFLASVQWTPEQVKEIARVFEWLADNPDAAAEYIVWLQDAVDE